jgi:catechol 2,3-dioxygenase-like lactoylglutathione lyase family enzyme
VDILTSRTIIHPSDLDRSLDFYGRVLGLAVAREFGEGPGRGVVFFVGGGLLEVTGAAGAAGSAGSAGGPALPHAGAADGGRSLVLWLQVRDMAAALDEVVAHGVHPVRPAVLEPWGLIEAWVDDPDGLRIHLVEVPADHPLRRDLRGGAPAADPGADTRFTEGGSA